MSKTGALLRCLVRAEHPLVRTYASALFISGDKAFETFSLLSPYLNPDERLSEPAKLKRELELRGLDVDVEGLAKTWRFYKHVKADKSALDVKRSEIAQAIKELNKKERPTEHVEKEKISLTTQGKLLKREVRALKEALWEMEENVVPRILKLPNILHDRTPHESPVILSSRGESPKDSGDSPGHLEIGAALGLIDYKNALNCYLNDEAALFELGALSYASEFLSDEGMTRIAGTDFARSLVVEAAGLDHEDPDCTFILRNNEDIEPRTSSNRLHLVGGASLASFLSMHAKQLVNPNHFPLRYFATGREYVPENVNPRAPGLLGISQSSIVRAFVAVKDPNAPEYTEEFERLNDHMTRLYESLEIHYRTVLRSAKELAACESLGISYELWSPHLGDYVEVGRVSMCDKYLSERLVFAYQTPNGRDFPAVITATVMSVSKLLACLLERDPAKFCAPPKILQHMRLFC